MKQSVQQSLQRSFDLLGNPIRFRIFQKILAHGCDCDIETQSGRTGNCVSGIMQELDLPQSTVSTYIKELSDGGLITCTRTGKYLYCKPNKQALLVMRQFIEKGLTTTA